MSDLFAEFYLGENKIQPLPMDHPSSNLLKAVYRHSQTTSLTDRLQDGHIRFTIDTSPDGPFLRCQVCGKCLPLPIVSKPVQR